MKKNKNIADKKYNHEKHKEISENSSKAITSYFIGIESIKEYILFGKEILGFIVYMIWMGINIMISSCSFYYF